MRAGIQKRDLRCAMLIIGIALMLGCAAYYLVASAVQRQMSEHASHQSALWADYFAREVGELELIAQGTKPSPYARDQLDLARKAGSVFRFKVFDAQGRLRYDSDKPEAIISSSDELAAHNPKAAESVRTGRPYTKVAEGQSPNRPELYGETYQPIIQNGHIVAVVETYVDLSAFRSSFNQNFIVTTLALVGLVAFGFVGPAAGFLVKSRQKERALTCDPVTGLANRSALRARMQAAVTRAEQEPFAILNVDIDRFKAINDTYGDDVGNDVLREVAGRLERCAGADALTARLGNDEFAIMVPVAKGEERVRALANAIARAFAKPVLTDGDDIDDVDAHATIGIAVFPKNGENPNSLLQHADLAKRQARAEREPYKFYEMKMEAEIGSRKRLEQDLQKALGKGEFETAYQPQVNANSDELQGFEALLRWNHPELGRVSPAEFIPIAEDTGLIDSIGAWMILRACSSATTWPAHISISVNVSPVQLRNDNIIGTIKSILSSTGLQPNRLELEITESIFLDDQETAVDILSRLKEIGIRIVMDDFGTGYSSLGYLLSFPFDKIKLDQCFVRDLPGSREAHSITAAVVALGKSLGMKTTAEGVETAEQLAVIKKQGYDEIQGYFYNPPMSGSDVAETYFPTTPGNRASQRISA